MKNPAVKWGVYALIFTIVWTLFEHVMGYNTTNHQVGQYARMLGAIVFWICIFIAVFATRKQQGGTLSFWQGFKAGTVISIVYSLGVCAWYAVYGEVINKDFKPTLMAFERAKLEAANASADVIAAKMKQVDMQTGGSVISYVFLVVFMMLIGLVVTAIASLIAMRKKKATA